jgi:hypothetical protein
MPNQTDSFDAPARFTPQPYLDEYEAYCEMDNDWEGSYVLFSDYENLLKAYYALVNK